MNRLAKPADGSDDLQNLGVDEAANRNFVEFTKFDLDVRSATFEFYALPSNFLTVAITCPGSNPNFRSSFKGAEAPNVLMLMTRPWLPT